MTVSPAVSLSKKKGAVIGRVAAYRSLKKLGRLCNQLFCRDEARRIAAKLAFKVHPHMLRHACGYALANEVQPL
jgi:hypothetical protein